jgi:hypothetical protein
MLVHSGVDADEELASEGGGQSDPSSTQRPFAARNLLLCCPRSYEWWLHGHPLESPGLSAGRHWRRAPGRYW